MTLLSPPRRTEYQPKHAIDPTERRRSEQTSTLLVLLILLITTGFVAGTTATFTSSVSESASRFAMASLNRPTNLSGEMAGTGAALGWLGVTGDNNAGAGYNVLWADAGAPTPEGSSPTCNGVTSYAKIGDTAAASYLDTSADTRAESPPGTARPGRYVCYQVQTVYPYPPSASPWISQGTNPVRDLQIGFVAATVTLNNGANNFQMAAGDTIKITFNQPVDISTGPAAGTTPATGSAPRICSNPSNGSEFVLIGGMGLHDDLCLPGETALVGVLTPAANRINSGRRYHVTWAWSNCPVVGACKELTATLGSTISGSNVTTGSHTPWTFTPATTLASATGAVPVCTVNPVGGLCQPLTTGGW